MSNQTFRLVTRSDFDGLVCAVLFKELDMIDDIKFVHPKDMQDGIIEISERDITTNLPYVASCHLAFDHHHSETVRVGSNPKNHIIDPNAASAARVVYDHYGGKAKFPNVDFDLMEAVDKADSAQFSEKEILEPKDWVLMNFLMDSRTGLGRFRDFRISNYELMMDLIDSCRTRPISEIMETPDLKERVELYCEHESKFKEQIQNCSRLHNNVVHLNLRDEGTIYAGNRFMIYAMYPQINISIHEMWGLKKQNTVFAVGKSIINRTNESNVGELCLKYGGGGHKAAGTCQVPNDQADSTRLELIEQLQS